MELNEVKQAVFDANRAIVTAGLVLLSWGNASAVDRERGLVVIKPSGVDYATLGPEQMVVVDLQSGSAQGPLRPSSDTPTHLELYRSFPAIGAVVHTHSTHATAFAQAQLPLGCYGTTHADHFGGCIPVTRPLRKDEIQGEYELNTGKLIVECFREGGLDPVVIPGVLVASHGPFAWGPTPCLAVENAIVLEEIARMTYLARTLNPQLKPIPQALLDKHFQRKHGAGAYYGQPKTN